MEELTDEMKSAIQFGAERRDVEFKPPIKWHDSQRPFKLEITKAAMALSNTPGGGNIVIGISQQQDRRPRVTYERQGLTNAQLDSYDVPDDIGRFISGKSNQSVRFVLHGGEVGGELGDKKFVVIKVFESTSYVPIICKDDHNSGNQRSLKKNAIYIRSLVEPFESREIESKEEWDELILRLLRHKEEFLHSDLMAVCQRLVVKEKTARPKTEHQQKSQQQYDKLLRRDKL